MHKEENQKSDASSLDSDSDESLKSDIFDDDEKAKRDMDEGMHELLTSSLIIITFR